MSVRPRVLEPLANPGVTLSAPGVLGEGSKDPRYGAASDARRQSERHVWVMIEVAPEVILKSPCA